MEGWGAANRLPRRQGFGGNLPPACTAPLEPAALVWSLVFTEVQGEIAVPGMGHLTPPGTATAWGDVPMGSPQPWR